VSSAVKVATAAALASAYRLIIRPTPENIRWRSLTGFMCGAMIPDKMVAYVTAFS
jgi:hypothetical protein